MTGMELYIAILVMVVVNYFTKVFPFLFFRKAKDLPLSVEFVGNYFPAIIMTILIFYSIKDIDYTSSPYASKEIIAISFTFFLHISVKNYLLSIFLGTIVYMFMVQYC